MKMTKRAADMLASVARKAAKEAAGTASWNGSCQPKEPANLKEFFKK